MDRNLAEVIRTSERDFLKVGAGLGAVLETVEEIARQAHAITGSASGERMAGAADALREVLVYAREMRSAEVSAELDTILSGTDSIRRRLEGLQGIVRRFRVLGVLMQIESARLQAAGEGFGSLAGEVKSLGGEIGEQSENILAVSGRMRTRVTRTLQQVFAAEESRMARLPALIGGIDSGLQSLREQREKSSNASEELAARYRNASRRVSDLVASLQYQDITRQQLEHVREALAQAADIDSVVELERAQLRSTAAGFQSSVRQIRESLSSIAQDASTMAQEAQDLLGMTRKGEESFFAEMEAGISEVLLLLADCSAADESRSAGLAELDEAVAQMNGLAHTIQAVTIRMQRIALNAAIRAIQIGTRGDALATVAGAIQHLAGDTGEIADDVSRGLAGVVGAVREMAARSRAASERFTGAEALKQSVQALHSAQQANFSRVEQVTGMADRLARDLEQACLGFGEQRAFAAVLENCVRTLDHVAGERRTGSNGPGREDLEALRSRYTMQAEREVHNALTGSEAGDAAPAAAAEDSEFGVNVEMF